MSRTEEDATAYMTPEHAAELILGRKGFRLMHAQSVLGKWVFVFWPAQEEQ